MKKSIDETTLRQQMANNPAMAYRLYLNATGAVDCYKTYKEFRLWSGQMETDYLTEPALSWMYRMEG